MPAKNQKKRRTRLTPTRTSEVLDVRMAAELLTVSPDTVYFPLLQRHKPV